MFAKYGPLWFVTLASRMSFPPAQFSFSWPGQSCAVAVFPDWSTAVMWISLLGCWKFRNWGGTRGTGSSWFVTYVNESPSYTTGGERVNV